MNNRKGTALACVLWVAASACVATPGAETSIVYDPIGSPKVRTVPVPAGLDVEGATYTPSGKVLVNFVEPGGDDRDIRLATVNDDGTEFRQFFAQAIPERPKDNGLRYMVFPDNQRIFLGDFVLECTTILETCTDPALVPVDYPQELAEGNHIWHRWSEMVVAPDNRHIAWTTLLANYSAMVFTGELVKQGERYVVAKPRIVSTIDPFAPDPTHEDAVLPQPVRGGEVKQFIQGGTALSVVGAITRDLPDSVIQHLATGELEAVTDTPGYTETTIFSPDEKLGLTMTTQFSDKTDPAILGLVPRPYPAALNMGLSMFAYTYAVTGVRRARPGSIGPALIDIAASKEQPGYLGTDLNTDPDWVYYSPMSWNPDSTKAMWIEGRREGGSRRIQIVELVGRAPTTPVPAGTTPNTISGAQSDLSAVKRFAAKNHDIDVKVYGRASGHITYRRTPKGAIDKTYVNFSDDGQSVYSGSESMRANISGNSNYTADITLSGPKPGRMKLTITFGPLGGAMPARIIFDKNTDGQPLSYGFAEYGGPRMEVADLVP